MFQPLSCRAFAKVFALFNKPSLVRRCLIENIAVDDPTKPLRTPTRSHRRSLPALSPPFVLITPTLAN